MNRISTIKPSGVMEQTNAVANPLQTNDTLWSDTTATWSDSGVMWSILFANPTATPPRVELESVKSKGIVRSKTPEMTTETTKSKVTINSQSP